MITYKLPTMYKQLLQSSLQPRTRACVLPRMNGVDKVAEIGWKGVHFDRFVVLRDLGHVDHWHSTSANTLTPG